MPPAYPAPSPQGNRPRRDAWRLPSRRMRTGEELLVSGPVRTASGWSKPDSFRPNGDYLFVPDIRKAVEEKAADIKAYVVGEDLKEIHLQLGDMTDAEREIILKGCLINYYRD